MSSVDQTEIAALLADATALAASVAEELRKPEASRFSPTAPLSPADPELARILKVRVPVIVELARRFMSIGAVRDFSVGAILEFEKPVRGALDLLINNRLVGRGTCVKVGENFGLRVTQICDRAERVRSMGSR